MAAGWISGVVVVARLEAVAGVAVVASVEVVARVEVVAVELSPDFRLSFIVSIEETKRGSIFLK